MQGFPGASPDLPLLQSTMRTFEQACSSIQMHINPAEAENLVVSLHKSLMPYKSCRFILENSQSPIARFHAAAAIRDAAIREWEILTDENKRSLILFCLCYVMKHTSSTDAYIQSKVSSVAAQLTKRGWIDFADTDKVAIFSEVKQAILGVHGVDAQIAGINFLESVVSEFSPATSTAMGLPTEFHKQCKLLLELNYLKEFYCWAQDAALRVSDRMTGYGAITIMDNKVCSAALQLMFEILNWNFKHDADFSNRNTNTCSSGIRHDTSLLKKFDHSLVQPGSAWRDLLISSGHSVWLLNLYATLRHKYSTDVIWIDSPFAISARQLIVQLCSLTGSLFPSDGEMQIKHLLQILLAIVQWIEPPIAISEAFRSRQSGSEIVDACHALLTMSTLTSTMLFDNLLRSQRPFGTLHLLSSLTCELVKANAINKDEEETWISDALEILLETWNVILGHSDTESNSISPEGITAISNLFNVIVDSHLNAAAESAFDDDDDFSHFHASVSKRDETLGSYALIGRTAADKTIPFLIKLFSERFALFNQNITRSDPTRTLEELYWLLLISGHVLTDSGEGETILVPEALHVRFSHIHQEAHHPVVILSWSIINFARQSLDPEMREAYFSPRLMEAVIWFLARWVDTYLMPCNDTKGCNDISDHEPGQLHGSHHSRNILRFFAGEHNQGKLIVDTILRISVVALTSYPGENDLQEISCQKLLAALVRRRVVCIHLVELDSWCDIAQSFANKNILFTSSLRLQRPLAERLVCSASGMKDSDASNQYVRDLMGPTTSYLIEISARNDLTAVAQQPDVIFMVSCLLERLRGAVRACQPSTQKAVFEMGQSVMNSLLILLKIYKNQSAVVYLILKFVVDFVDEQVAYLNAKDTSFLVGFCMQLLQIYSSQNIGKISLSHSTSLQNEAQIEKYKDLRALLQLLTSISSKDLVDFSSNSDEQDIPDFAEVIYVGLHIVTPLISLDLLKYPKLSHDYFALLSHILEVYPEKVAHLNKESFAHIIGTLKFGLLCQVSNDVNVKIGMYCLELLTYIEYIGAASYLDIDVSHMCLEAVYALASYHYKERIAGKEGLGAHAITTHGSDRVMQEGILGHFLRILLQLLLFEDFRIELVSSAADALFALLLCEQDLYQKLVQEMLGAQSNHELKTRLGNAFHSLTSSNQVSSSLNRPNRHRFRKNVQQFLAEVSGFLRIK